MLQIFVVILIACIILRIYYYKLAKNEPVDFFTFTARFYSMRYFIPMQTRTKRKEDVATAKKANFFLYAFYVVFVVMVLYGILVYGLH